MCKQMNNPKNTLVLISDVFFVLLLCFIVLLLTMLLNRNAGIQKTEEYVINPAQLILVVTSTALYLYFMIKSSVKELSNIQKQGFDFSSSEDNIKDSSVER